MQKLIIVAALVACALAAPLENIKESFQTADLPRPSPINPDIPSDPKPEEIVTLITDAEEQPLEQTKVPQPTKLPGPYVPLIESLARSKRADKDSSESDEDSSEEDNKPSPPLKPRPLAGPSTTLLEKIAAKTSTTPAPESSTDSTTSDGSISDTSNPSTTTTSKRPFSHQYENRFKTSTAAADPSASSTSTVTLAPASSIDSSTSDGTSSDASTSSTTTTTTTAPRRPYSPLIHQHNEHRFRPTTEAPDSSTTTAAPSTVSSNDHINDKRDIPVPLKRKYHHDDDVTKQQEEPDTDETPKEEVKQEEKKDEDRKTEPAAHPATISRPIPVAELFAKKPPTTE